MSTGDQRFRQFAGGTQRMRGGLSETGEESLLHERGDETRLPTALLLERQERSQKADTRVEMATANITVETDMGTLS